MKFVHRLPLLAACATNGRARYTAVTSIRETCAMDLIGLRETIVPRTLDEVALSAGVRPLGGGTWLFSEDQPGLEQLVDLTALGWDGIERTPDGLVIGATFTIGTLRDLPDSPLFAQCADSLLASWKVQRIATVGGNIALSLPAGSMIALAVGLDAELLVCSPDGERLVPAAAFVTGVRANVLAVDEVLRAIHIPRSSLEARTAFRRISLSPLGRTGTLVTGRRDAGGATILGVTGGTARPHRLAFESPPGAAEVTAAVETIDDWYDDPHGSPDWRAAMTLAFALDIAEDLA
jgi:CO/xanthine dehydrogenase FAD-binding subunit